MGLVTLTLDYDASSSPTNLISTQTIFIPELGLLLFGFALAVPLWLAARRTRREVHI